MATTATRELKTCSLDSSRLVWFPVSCQKLAGVEMAEDIALLKARAMQLTEELAKDEKKIRAYRNEVHQAAKDFWHLANVNTSDIHTSECAGRRREELLKRVIEIDSGERI
jgi:hypothetical protein